jgi:hypothetical protein
MADVDISDLPAPPDPNDISDLPVPPTQKTTAPAAGSKSAADDSDTFLGAAIGHIVSGTAGSIVGGYKGLYDIVTGKGVDQAAQDITDTQNRMAYKPKGASAQAAVNALDSPYNPMNWVDQSGKKLADFAADRGAPPLVSTGLRILPDAAAALFGLRRGAGGGTSAPESYAEAPVTEADFNPLSGAAEIERQRLMDIRARGTAAGLDMPEGGTPARFAQASATNTPIANTIIRRNFGLPDDAPLTPEMLEAVRDHVAQKTYGPVRSEPDIGLSQAARQSIDNLPDIIRNKLKFQGQALEDATPETVSGDDAVSMSQRLRAVAKTYDKAFNRSGNPEAGSLADMAHEAVDQLESSVRDHFASSGRESIADNWEMGRRVIAQTHDVEATLDGAGNANLAQLRKRPYLSGPLDDLANLAGRYPEAFKTTRMAAPSPGLARRAAAAVAPWAGTAAGAAGGSMMGMPTVGAIGGRIAGERLAERILPP